MSKHLIAMAVVLLALAPARASAQIVNVQNALAKQPDQDGTVGQLELKLDWREGNNKLVDIGAAASLIVKRGRILQLAMTRGEYGRGADRTFKERTFAHVRTRVTIDCLWRWEVFGQHELDRFRRLTVRSLAGTGPALQLVSTKKLSALAGAAYMLEYERLDERMGTIDAGERTIYHRGSFYLTGTEQLGEAAAITQTVYFQPSLRDAADFRSLAELSITSKLSKHLALTDAVIVAYDSRPPDGIQRFDMQIRVALLLTL